MHVRQQVRAAAATALEDAGVASGRVYTSRATGIERDSLPAAYVATLSESVEVAGGKGNPPRPLRREIALSVTLIAEAAEGVEDNLDALAEAAEAALAGGWRMGGIAADTRLTGSKMAVNIDGESPIGTLVLSYNVAVNTKEGAAGAKLG